MKKHFFWLLHELASFVVVSIFTLIYDALIKASFFKSLKDLLTFQVPIWLLLIILNLVVIVVVLMNRIKGFQKKNHQYSEQDRLHDVEVFHRIIENFPEDSYKDILNKFCNTGYFQYSEIDKFENFYEKANMARNKFINKEVQQRIDNLQKSIHEFLKFVSLNSFSINGNENAGRLLQYENIKNYSVRDEKVLKLMDSLSKYIQNVEREFTDFRTLIGGVLKE